ncbi:MAG: methyltransferase domain-containing protein [Rickettsiales bacterium]|jgi:predicted SAM-dependent methyltransferase|nr:methyltransferase domain-containing protein [Rickettsiales bacterium]
MQTRDKRQETRDKRQETRTNTYTYSTVVKESWADRAAYAARLQIYKILSQNIDLDNLMSIIDVGVTADKTQISSNFFENLYPYPERIVAFSDQDAVWMEDKYKGLKFKRGTALEMPFEDNTFDLVFSSAVIEHLGTSENQNKFIGECLRIAKKYIFITTPNRYYPIELHTALPLIHWLPKSIHRKILKAIGNDFLSLEANLNLLTKKELRMFCKEKEIKKYKLLTAKFLGLSSNLLLLIEK